MYKGDKDVHAQMLEPLMIGSFRDHEHSLVHLDCGRSYTFLCGMGRYKIWQNTRKKVTCQKCLEAFRLKSIEGRS